MPRRTRLPRVCSFYVPPYFGRLADRLHQLTETIVDDDLASLFVLLFVLCFCESSKATKLICLCQTVRSLELTLCVALFFLFWKGRGLLGTALGTGMYP